MRILLTEDQIQAAKHAVTQYLASLGIPLPESDANQIAALLRDPRRESVQLPANERNVGGILMNVESDSYAMLVHSIGGIPLYAESAALMHAVIHAVAEARLDPLDVVIGAVQAYRYLKDFEFAWADVGQQQLGYGDINMLQRHNDDYPPIRKDVAHGRQLAWQAFQQVVATRARTLDEALIDDCFVALIGVVLSIQPPAGMSPTDLVKTLLANVSTGGVI